MGNRAIVRFDEGDKMGCGVYLHWNGAHVKEWLKEASPRMRKGDASYAAARFCGFWHERMEGGLSLGILAPDACTAEAAEWQDNGMYVVDVNTGKVHHVLRAGKMGRPFTIEMGAF